VERIRAVERIVEIACVLGVLAFGTTAALGPRQLRNCDYCNHNDPGSQLFCQLCCGSPESICLSADRCLCGP
jgi:hypothetical protein